MLHIDGTTEPGGETLSGDGRYPPFAVFDDVTQDWRGKLYRYRWQARFYRWRIAKRIQRDIYNGESHEAR